jgi:DNA (cytosine-5)-methyltransferase 1
MENVLGIRSASGGEYFTRVQAEGRALGYSVVAREEDASKLGVPQNRKRQLFIGVRLDVPGYLSGDLYPSPRAVPGATLGDAIMDLPALPSPGGAQEMDYDLERRARHTSGNKHHFIYRVLQVSRAAKLTAHESRRHSERDLRDFAKIREGENSSQAMRDRGIKFEFPYDKSSFKDRYTRQHRNRPCSTIVAHLSKDGLMFIHPTQQRSLTPREAARVQTFPDWFQFPVSRTHQYRVIGNAVPPLVGEAVGHTVANFLEIAATLKNGDHPNVLPFEKSRKPHRLPADTAQALEWLATLASKTRHQLRRLEGDIFLQGWHALLYLYPGLHPDSALDHGEDEELVRAPHNTAVDLSRRYVRSGWPVSLELIGREAWRRYNENQMDETEFYCVSAQTAGMQQSVSEGALMSLMPA